MKGKLWVKLFLSFMFIILVSGGLIMGVLTNRISSQFKAYVKNGDIVAARGMAPLLGRYYDLNGSWNGVLRYLPMAGMRMGEGPRMKEVPMERRTVMGDHRRIVITDHSGTVLVDSIEASNNRAIRNLSAENGTPIIIGSRTVGLLYMGTMIQPALNPLGESFLLSIRRSVFAAVIPALLLALIVTLLMVRHITRPLESMKAAAGKISGGDFTARSGVSRNDELGDLARAFDEMTVSLEKGEEWKRRIIADSAHELRTPVSLIQGSLEMMSDGVYPLEKERIMGLYEETLRLTELIAGLQELAGLEADGAARAKTEIDLREIALDAASAFEPMLKEKGAELKVNEGVFPPVIGNPGRLKQVFFNLFTNAIRYIPEKGEIFVDFQSVESTGEVKVSVCNNGPEIPEDELHKIFERFYRVDKSRTREAGGRGLGLAICAEILKNHDGRIEAANLPLNRGVRFDFYLPHIL